MLAGASLALAVLFCITPVVAVLIPYSSVVSDVARILEGPTLYLFGASAVLSVLAASLGALRPAGIVMVCIVGSLFWLLQPWTAQWPDRGWTGDRTIGQNTIRVLETNILGDNLENGARIAEAIIASGADVVIVQEAEPLLANRDRLNEVYAYHTVCPGFCDLLVLSKLPILDTTWHSMTTLWSPRAVRLSLGTSEGVVITIVAAHLSKGWMAGFADIEQARIENLLARVDRPIVLAGDFNAAPWSRRLRAFRGLGVEFAILPPATWPAGAGALGIPIDHIGVVGELRLLSIVPWEGAVGSNHRGLLAEIGLPAP